MLMRSSKFLKSSPPLLNNRPFYYKTKKSRLLLQSIRKNPSSSSSSSSFPGDKNSTNVTPTANIIQGPSLLTSTGKHRPSPTLFQLPGLRSLPFWTSNNSDSGLKVAYNEPILTSIVSYLESNVEIIKSEYIDAIQSQNIPSDYDVKDEHMEGSLHTGKWDWHSYILKGVKSPIFPLVCPKTTSIINNIASEKHLFSSTPFSFVFFSTLNENSSIKPHYGPMNLRLRVHLPLITPSVDNDDDSSSCMIRVGNQAREFKEGKAIVLDDSYEHEVWNTTSMKRVTLAVDIWHPDVDLAERYRIQDMFRYAKEQGWISNNNDAGK